ncbi:MAG: hypothetical protein QM767_02710 [Anaeromyxobacter sp.]
MPLRPGRLTLLTLASLLALVAAPAHAALTLELDYGLARPPSGGLEQALDGAGKESDLFATSLQVIGGAVLLDLGGLELGAVADSTSGKDSPSQTAVGGLFGVRFGDKLRLELLGEAGGHRYGDFLQNPDVVTASSKEEWLFYVGLRPGFAYRFDLIPKGPGLVLGIWAFARWDVKSKDVPVTVGSGGSPGTLSLGGTSIGATLRAGIEF